MADKGFSLDFDGFLDLARDIGELGGDHLKQAVENAFTASKGFVNAEIEKAMDESKYHFDGTGHSKGKAKKSLNKVRQNSVEWEGNTATAYIGVDLADAPEILFTIYGTPHMAKDKKLYNAIKVKGNIKNEVDKIQKEEFNKVITEALKNG